MDTDWLLFIFTILIPAIMVLLGVLMQKRPPKKRNWFVGYRTERSMLSQETWDFANRGMGRNWLCVGVPVLVATALIYWLVPADKGMLCMVLVLAQMAALIIPIFPVEAELKKRFDGEGKPRA